MKSSRWSLRYQYVMYLVIIILLLTFCTFFTSVHIVLKGMKYDGALKQLVYAGDRALFTEIKIFIILNIAVLVMTMSGVFLLFKNILFPFQELIDRAVALFEGEKELNSLLTEHSETNVMTEALTGLITRTKLKQVELSKANVELEKKISSILWIFSASENLNASLIEEKVIENLAALLKDKFRINSVLAIYNEEKNDLKNVYSFGLPGDFSPEGLKSELKPLLQKREEGQSPLSATVASPQSDLSGLLPYFGEVYFLYNRGETLGFLLTGGKSDGSLITPEEQGLLHIIASIFSSSLNNAIYHRKMARAQTKLMISERLSAIGQISAGVAHEINNPIFNIITYAGLAEKETAGGERLMKFLGIVRSEADKCKSIVQNLMDFSREESVSKARFSLTGLINRRIGIFRETYGNVEFFFSSPGELMVSADGEKLDQALTNIFLNSIQAMEGGAGKITVSLDKRHIEAEKYLCLAVRDSGCGIPKDKLDRIFGPFFTTKANGLGMGLALTKKTVDLHNGRIEVDSSPGNGTEIRIFLPEI